MKYIKITLIIIFFLNTSLSAKSNYFDEGVTLYEQKEFQKAKFKFEQDIVYNPKNEFSYLYLSKIFKKQKNLDLEEKNLKAVILLNPRNEEATFNLVQLRFRESDYSGSKKLIDQLLIFCKEYCSQGKQLKIEIENSIKK